MVIPSELKTPVTNNNLYNAYWSKYIQEITDKDSKIVRGHFHLTPADMEKLSFRDLYFFDGNYFRLNKIEDYDPINPSVNICEFLFLKTGQSFTATTGSVGGGGEQGPRRQLVRVLVVVLGVGLFVHEALKNRMGHPRPEQVVQMGGAAPYVPVYTVSHWCQSNCSFVSGHAAIGFSVLGLGMWAPLRQRRRWWLAGMALGGGIGWVRIAQGGHFLSDIVFAGLAIWGSAILIRQGWLRWRVRQLRGRPG